MAEATRRSKAHKQTHPLICIPRIVVQKSLERGLLRRAKIGYPKEYVEAIFGKYYPRRHLIEIHALMDVVHKSNPNAVYYDEDEVKISKEWAKENNLEWLGTVHSHTAENTFAEASICDHHGGYASGELVSGVLVIKQCEGSKRYWSKIYWWIPQGKIQVHYT